MSPTDAGSEINMSGIRVSGVGGLGLVALAMLMTAVLPAAWWLVVVGATGGVLLAAMLIVVRRVYRASGPTGDDPRILFRAPAAANADIDRSAADTTSDARLAIAH